MHMHMRCGGFIPRVFGDGRLRPVDAVNKASVAALSYCV